jgi:hypothetical protein
MWSVHFGSSNDSPADLEVMKRRLSPPDNEFPAACATSFVLARTDDLAIMVRDLTCYTTGLGFDLDIRLRSTPAGLQPHEVSELVHGWGTAVDRRLLVGIEYPDGRKASNLVPMLGAAPAEDQPTVVVRGGGSGDRSVEQGFWLTPLPPDGPVTFVCSWQVVGIEEARYVVEDAQLTSLSSRVEVLWPWQPLEPATPEPLPAPDLPTTGWFADAATSPESGATE